MVHPMFAPPRALSTGEVNGGRQSFEDLKQLGVVSSYNSKLSTIKAALGTFISNRIFNGQELDAAEDELSLLNDAT